ncbi:DUF4189 domain-containing protein [Xanthomonas translucens]|uniref:DUF4189 domain-containing protein n=1 Tax=Xanthomonas campestris pv. translucens TaxID=343 RepID=UPI001F157BC8|nr:DUF4189 domain-containing protein [Xanthomonas translucens]UKE52484.1 DUF4189 domain-containing protein [Xanthomonas translucens]
MLLTAAINANAEQGCPPGQLPAQSNGNMSSCGPIPPGYYQQQEAPAPRPSGKWLKTWGAIASDDDGGSIGVSKGKLKKVDAQNDALSQCKSVHGKECKVEFVYENQCTAIAEPYLDDKPIEGVISFTGGPTKDVAGSDALSSCKKNNANASCRIMYTACSEPIFEPY